MRRELGPGDGRRCEARDVDRDTELAGDGAKSGDVIGMFVGDENCVERFGIDADGGQALEGFLAAEAGVN